MFKIYESGNYFYIEETASSKLFKGHKKDVLVSQTFEGGTEFCFVGIFGNFGCKNCIEFADIVDLNDAPFASLQAFIDFYEANTGNFNSGVPAALNGPVNRLINYFANDYTDLVTNIALTPVDGEIAIVRNPEGTAWLPYTLGGSYYPKGGYIYNGVNWIPNTDLITQQLSINIDDISDLETDLTNHVADLANPHAVTAAQIGVEPGAQVNDYKVKVDAADVTAEYLEDKLLNGPEIKFDKTIGATKAIIASVVSFGLNNSKLQQVSSQTLKGRSSAGSGVVEDLSASQARTILNVADGAEVNVKSDWNEANPASDSFILNKPTLSNVNISDIAISQGNLIQSILTVPTLTATVNNWNPAGFNANTDLIRVDVNANNREITGIIAPAVGLNRILAIKNLNNAGLDIRFSNNNAGSLAENRFLCRDNNNKSIKPNEMAVWFYDHIIQRWTPFNRIG